METLVQLSTTDAIKLGTRDLPTFGHIFFPKTFRQKSPALHFAVSEVLTDRTNRLVGLEMFRDAAKTTLARTYAAKRLAYCISRTILFVNINATKAQHSLRWIKRQVEFNARFRDTFQLRKGEKWTDEWATVYNSQGEPVNLLAMGITGGLRGVNIDDFRPDFIFLDDVCDAENMGTEEGRAKVNEAVFAQLVRSLTPASEAPLAQLVIAQTPINTFDIISQAKKDPTFRVFTYSCFGPDGQSAWPERRSTDELLAEKQGYINRNQLSTWLAEMECQLISGELQAFVREWLQYWNAYPEDGECVIVVDPASSEEKTADFFAIAVLCFYGKNIYLLDYHLARGMMPDAACDKIFEFVKTYKATQLVVETVAYQKILAWYLRKEIEKRRVYIHVHEYDDKRKKDDRIVQSITQVAPYGNLWIREGMTEFEEVFQLYGPGYRGKVDLLDAVSIGIAWKLQGYIRDPETLEGEFQRLREVEASIPDINDDWRGAP